MQFICPRCGESSPKYIGYKNDAPYCRRCIRFKGELAPLREVRPLDNALKIDYKLTRDQKRISTRVIKNYIEGKSTLIKAVCGAGKTELVYGVISYAISRGQTVGFAIPRRDVVVELHERLLQAFPTNRVVAVYGGHHNFLDGDIVVLTTHQIYRYENYFDLLIMDEVDAFPFVGDPMLFQLSDNSVKQSLVMMSATPEDSLIRLFSEPNHEILELNTRYHGHGLPVPSIELHVGYFKELYLEKKLRYYIAFKKPVLIFAPTIELCREVYKKLKDMFPNGNYVHSKKQNRSQIIKDFKSGLYKYLVTTAVLERGVTIKNLQVIIYDADSEIYTKSALVQISGRVGRKYDAPDGEVIFLASLLSESMEEAKREIENKNMFL